MLNIVCNSNATTQNVSAISLQYMFILPNSQYILEAKAV